MVPRPRDLASRMAGRRKPDDGYLRETFTLPREEARARARDFLNRYPKAAYMSSVESWRELPGGDIEFTMRRLSSDVSTAERRSRSICRPHIGSWSRPKSRLGAAKHNAFLKELGLSLLPAPDK